MCATDRLAPRSLLLRPLITLEVTPAELSVLVVALNAKACRAAEDPEQMDFADYLFRRVADLREAFR